MSRMSALVTGLAVALTLPFSLSAADLAPTHFKVIGAHGTNLQYTRNQEPFWSTDIVAASNGAITADVTPVDQMGIDDFSLLRLLKLGVTDIVSFDVSKMAGDDPRFEGCDLAGISLTLDEARAACEAYLPVLDEIMQADWGAKILAVNPQPPQVFWCRVPISGLADLKGKKVRVFNNTMRDFLQAVEAEAISMSFPEVVPALQRGVVDCAVTGTLSGNTAGWPEVSTHLYPMYMGWSIGLTAISLGTWNRLTPEVQAFIEEQMATLLDRYWEIGGRQAVVDAENCNFNKDPCELGKKADMTLVPVADEEKALHKELVETVVLKNWAERAGSDAAAKWNETVGKALGLTAPTS
ncbi:MAG: TRAP transporter substrate-binding protein [Alphaproteobacteria bacterium]|nr:TRAP transporter substrate-binding protein [Alphaproteobacteria bacterium]